MVRRPSGQDASAMRPGHVRPSATSTLRAVTHRRRSAGAGRRSAGHTAVSRGGRRGGRGMGVTWRRHEGERQPGGRNGSKGTRVSSRVHRRHSSLPAPRPPLPISSSPRQLTEGVGESSRHRADPIGGVDEVSRRRSVGRVQEREQQRRAHIPAVGVQQCPRQRSHRTAPRCSPQRPSIGRPGEQRLEGRPPQGVPGSPCDGHNAADEGPRGVRGT